ncbi:c-type cytochrome [Xanthobacter sp. AM11]|uniref:c-type cytochrome n=1 Tax=Xanthobacter sp. AM11 TaxID=3380643 RepID=UPI0039BEDF93
MKYRPAQQVTAFGARLAAAVAVLACAPAQASGDREFGAYLSAPCVTCHQPSGKAAGGVPVITGWPQDQFIAVMMSYRRHERDSEVMRTLAAGLTDEEIAALAAYFADLKPAH